MKLNEITNVDEDWKHAVAAGALALSGLSGGSKVDAPAPSPETHHIQQAPTPTTVPNLTGTKMESTLHKTAVAAGLKGEELAQFLAQCAHESQGFTRMREVGTPKYFATKYDPHHAPTTAKLLGNTKAGDGEKYRGAGPMQVTGKYWFGQAQKDLGIPLLKDPSLANNPAIAAELAVWYWKKRVRPYVTDFSDTKAVTRHINSGLDKVERREELFNKYSGVKK